MSATPYNPALTTASSLPSQPLPGPNEFDQSLQESQGRMFRLVFEVGVKMGKIIQTLHLEKLSLESANRALDAEITQLKLIHQTEFNAVVASRSEKIQMIFGKIKTVVTKFESYQTQKGWPWVFSSDSKLVLALLDIPKPNDERGSYPDYSDRRTNACKPQEQTSTQPSDALVLTQVNPVLVQSHMGDFEQLKSEIAPIRATNFALIDKKEMMIDFHGKKLAEMRHQEIVQLKEILEKVRSLYSRIQWEKLGTSNISYYYNGGCDAVEAAAFHQISQATLSKKMHKTQERVKAIISMLGAFVNPQQTGKER